jgi:hypothetical protein
MTLLFGINAKEIVNVVQVNQVVGKGALLEAYKQEVQELRSALANGGGVCAARVGVSAHCTH